MGDKSDKSNIESYFNKVDTETEGNDTVTSKRLRSDGSSASESPSSKRIEYDDEANSISIPEDAPFWVPLLFKAFDRVNDHVLELSTKFDNFTCEVEVKLGEIQKETETKFQKLAESFKDTIKVHDTKIEELTDSVKFISGTYESQKAVVQGLVERIKVLEEHHETLKRKCHDYEAEIVSQSEEIDGLAQYSRRNCALIHGVPEAEGENTDNVFIATVQSHLGVTIKADE